MNNLFGHYCDLAHAKVCSSNVVEKCLKLGGCQLNEVRPSNILLTSSICSCCATMRMSADPYQSVLRDHYLPSSSDASSRSSLSMHGMHGGEGCEPQYTRPL